MSTQSKEARWIADFLGIEEIDDDPKQALRLTAYHQDVIHGEETREREGLDQEKFKPWQDNVRNRIRDENLAARFEESHGHEPEHRYYSNGEQSVTDLP